MKDYNKLIDDAIKFMGKNWLTTFSGIPEEICPKKILYSQEGYDYLKETFREPADCYERLDFLEDINEINRLKEDVYFDIWKLDTKYYTAKDAAYYLMYTYEYYLKYFFNFKTRKETLQWINSEKYLIKAYNQYKDYFDDILEYKYPDEFK